MKMSLGNIYNKIVCISPYLEVLVRRFYWNNVETFAKFKPKFSNSQTTISVFCEFERILEALENLGVKKGSLLIVHSSYDALERTGLSPDEIIDALLELIGCDGTLAMPVIRRYKEQPKKGKEYITCNMDTIKCTYNVQRSRVVTGFLPYYMMLRKNCVISRHPLNPMAAIGPLAELMMKNNIEGEKPSPHGSNSSWKFCLDNKAIVIGLGVDLGHYLTITHVAEEAYSDWPIMDWYRERKFTIVDHDYTRDIVVRERKPKWGTMFFAERNLKKRLLKKGILRVCTVGNIDVSAVDSQEYISYLRSINDKGFPYIVPKKYLKKDV
ncbi:AAC(3) family N-acetyltransferase [Bacteroides sp. HPS0048]|uniref:AAC(3) family N-acetyltransferase n=1 Tax=Bacteroides sp. HPS0048 TaxID=1078089 RepID=UPI0035696DEC